MSSEDPSKVLKQLPDKLFFRIGEVASVIGVEPHVLRYWENEFQIKPQRSVSGQRLYRKQDISRFLRIRHLLHQKGFTVAGARKLLKETPNLDPGISSEAINETIQRVEAIRERLRSLKDEAINDGP